MSESDVAGAFRLPPMYPSMSQSSLSVHLKNIRYKEVGKIVD